MNIILIFPILYESTWKTWRLESINVFNLDLNRVMTTPKKKTFFHWYFLLKKIFIVIFRESFIYKWEKKSSIIKFQQQFVFTRCCHFLFPTFTINTKFEIKVIRFSKNSGIYYNLLKIKMWLFILHYLATLQCNML